MSSKAEHSSKFLDSKAFNIEDREAAFVIWNIFIIKSDILLNVYDVLIAKMSHEDATICDDDYCSF